jgi:hypothetical protein
MGTARGGAPRSCSLRLSSPKARATLRVSSCGLTPGLSGSVSSIRRETVLVQLVWTMIRSMSQTTR